MKIRHGFASSLHLIPSCGIAADSNISGVGLIASKPIRLRRNVLRQGSRLTSHTQEGPDAGGNASSGPADEYRVIARRIFGKAADLDHRIEHRHVRAVWDRLRPGRLADDPDLPGERTDKPLRDHGS